MANTQIASATSGTVWLVLSSWLHKANVVDILNGAVAGLAGITPASGYVSTQSALCIGLLLGIVSYWGVEIIKFRLHVDDALDVSSVHGLTGIVGSLAIGVCASTGAPRPPRQPSARRR